MDTQISSQEADMTSETTTTIRCAWCSRAIVGDHVESAAGPRHPACAADATVAVSPRVRVSARQLGYSSRCTGRAASCRCYDCAS